MIDKEIDFGNPSLYKLIGDKYFLVYDSNDAYGNQIRTLKKWSRKQLIQDFSNCTGKMQEIHRYLGMTCIPENIKYSENVHGFFNGYHPLDWDRKPGPWPSIQAIIKHIFGDFYELGLDYFQLLYQQPLQKLPILLLISKARATGKTTFIKLLQLIFRGNMAIVPNEALNSRFNSYWSERLIVAIEEASGNKAEFTSKLKSLSTANTIMVERKGMECYESINFCKFLITSNDIDRPVVIEENETRFFVLDVPELTTNCYDILENAREEIPAFLDFLMNRKLSVPAAQDRLWFKPETYRTKALEHIIRACNPSAERELAELLLEVIERYGETHIEYTYGELKLILSRMHSSVNNLHDIIRQKWGIVPAQGNLSYDCFPIWKDEPEKEKHKGRYYTFTKELLESKLD